MAMGLLEQVERASRQTMERLRQEGLPATPDNYAVFYAYYIGSSPDLTRTIDILVSNHQAITDERCVELHGKFLGGTNEAAALMGFGGKLQDSVASVMTALESAGTDAARYGEALTKLGGDLGLARTLDQLKSIVKSMAEETAGVAARNKALQAELSESSRAVETLRQDLDNVRREAMTDGLTGLTNRKAFDLTLRERAASAMEKDQPMSLMMIDIDHFKKFNDNHGHVTGDQVLKLVARTLSELARSTDTAARYGGEEFAIILPNTPIDQAMAVAERIRQVVATRQIIKRTTSERLGNITLSIGVAQYSFGESLTNLIQRADAGLYQAKGAGRNRVMLAPETLSTAA